MILKLADFKKRLEYSLCQQFASEDDVREFCERALSAGVGVVCVNPVNVALASRLVLGTGMELSSNVGFPFGSHRTEVKVLETHLSVEEGATQIDRDDLVPGIAGEPRQRVDGKSRYLYVGRRQRHAGIEKSVQRHRGPSPD